MSYKNISTEITTETLTSVIQKLKEIDEVLPFTINLTAGEKRALPKMGDKSVAFVEKAHEFAVRNPEYLPAFLKVEEFKRDIDLTKALKSIMNVISPVEEKISDTFYAVGSEAFSAALTFYNSAKRASKSGVPGSDTIVAELHKRYKQQKRS
jgi:hypothetical protein